MEGIFSADKADKRDGKGVIVHTMYSLDRNL